MSTQQIVLSTPVRTAIGAFGGSLKGVPATELGATVVRETLRRAKLDPAAVGSVVLGNVIQAGNKMNPARQAAIGGGVPVSVPAMTVNRVCGSGAQAIITAAQQIATGEVEAAVADAPRGTTREWIIALFAINGFLNILWSLLFFRLRRPDWALGEVGFLWLSILLPIVVLARFSKPASALLLPYLAWVSFAAVLNWKVVQLNAPFAQAWWNLLATWSSS